LQKEIGLFAKRQRFARIVHMKTAKQAAIEIGCSASTVTKWAKLLGYTEKYGSCLALSQKQVADIARKRKTKAGNPNFGKK